MTARVYDDVEGRTEAMLLGDRLLNRLLPALQVDDRFRELPQRAALLTNNDDTDEGRLPLGVAGIAPAQRRQGSELPPWTMQFVLPAESEERLCELVSALLPPEGLELWVRPERRAIISEIEQCWPEAYNCRRLHLMAVDLPVSIEPLPTRALDPTNDDDLAAVVRVNNAAFQSHPDQAGMTVDSVRAKLAGIGHSAAGVRLADIDGQINGFCWTQIHHRRALGEISVIGLHPDVHGRGLGAPMTAAGLQWMHRQGLSQAILYVEAGNTAAVRSYERLGFATAHDDVSWMIPGTQAGSQHAS